MPTLELKMPITVTQRGEGFTGVIARFAFRHDAKLFADFANELTDGVTLHN